MEKPMGKNRWSVWIDVEGFSAIYSTDEARAIRALGELMEALFNIGRSVFAEPPDRLFIHQFGDGFVIVSDSEETTPDRPVAICLAAIRHLLARGVVTKAAISGGGFADIGSCYPQTVMSDAKDRHRVKMGRGLMTIIPHMGTALIASKKLADQRSGAVLLIDPSVFAGVPTGVTLKPGTLPVIDWVHSNFAKVDEICSLAGLTKVNADVAEMCLRGYIHAYRGTLREEWITSTLESVGMTTSQC
jgi:hypothetical protein